MELPPLNTQRCYVHVEDNHESGAQAVAGKSPVTTDQSKKSVGSQETPLHGARLVGGQRG
jgi:hypothetical protein